MLHSSTHHGAHSSVRAHTTLFEHTTTHSFVRAHHHLSGLRAKAAGVLDSMATAKLNAGRHERRDADLGERPNGLNGEAGPATFVGEGVGVEEFVQKHVANVTNFHTHSATCQLSLRSSQHVGRYLTFNANPLKVI